VNKTEGPKILPTN